MITLPSSAQEESLNRALKKKISRRERKKYPRMKVHGRSIFVLKKAAQKGLN
jgi:hypothetical protein